MSREFFFFFFFFFNDTATTEIYTLSLHDALPISNAANRARADASAGSRSSRALETCTFPTRMPDDVSIDRKSTRLNSSHSQISYAVFCLKKKKKHKRITNRTIALYLHFDLLHLS